MAVAHLAVLVGAAADEMRSLTAATSQPSQKKVPGYSRVVVCAHIVYIRAFQMQLLHKFLLYFHEKSQSVNIGQPI